MTSPYREDPERLAWYRDAGSRSLWWRVPGPTILFAVGVYLAARGEWLLPPSHPCRVKVCRLNAYPSVWWAYCPQCGWETYRTRWTNAFGRARLHATKGKT